MAMQIKLIVVVVKIINIFLTTNLIDTGPSNQIFREHLAIRFRHALLI